MITPADNPVQQLTFHVGFGANPNALGVQARKNLVTNPSFETNATGWTVANGTSTGSSIASSTYVAVGLGSNLNDNGGASLGNWNAGTGAALSAYLSTTVTTTVGVTYYVQAKVWLNGGAPAMRLWVVGIGWIGLSSGTGVNAWVTLTGSFVATGSTAIFGIANVTSVAGQIYAVDMVCVEANTTLWPYFDGNMSGGTWTGTANASTSTTYWTNITDQVILRAGVNMSTGKTHTDRIARPGSLTLTVDNSRLNGTEGRWTLNGPNQTTGWALRVPIQIRYNNSAIWTGYVETVSTRYEAGYRPIVTITAVDILARWQRLNIANALTAEQLVDKPDAFWPLNDQGTVATNRGSQPYGNLTIESFQYFLDGAGGLLLGQDTPALWGVDTFTCAYSITSTNGNGKYLSTGDIPDFNATTHPNTTWSFYFYQSSPTSTGAFFSMYGRPNSTSASVFFNLELNNGNINTRYFIDLSVSDLTSTSAVTTNQPLSSVGWYHITVTHQATSATLPGYTNTWTVYVNGVSVLTTTYTMTNYAYLLQAMQQNVRILIGGSVDNVVNTSGSSTTRVSGAITGWFANFAFYNSALTTTRIGEHAKLINGFTPETSDTRYRRICSYAGLPSTTYNALSRSNVTMGPQQFNDTNGQGRGLLDLINEVAISEYGDVTVNGSGQVIFRARLRKYETALGAPWVTIPASAINADNGWDFDQTFLANDATLTNGNGQIAHSENTTSVTAYGRQNITESVYLNILNELEAAARGRAVIESTPGPRLRDMTVDLVTAPQALRDQFDTLMLIDQSKSISITGLPSASSPTATLNMFVDGWSDSITESSWQRTFVASPITSFYTNTWTLNTSTLSTNTQLAY
jgi:hypothetical protein